MKKSDLLLGIITSLLSLFYIWHALRFPAGNNFLNSSRSFPILLGSSLLVCSVFLVIKTYLRQKEVSISEKITVTNFKRGIFYIIWILIYIFLGIPFLGFIYATLIYVIIGISYYKEVKWYWSIVVSLGNILFIYCVFHKLMFIRFP